MELIDIPSVGKATVEQDGSLTLQVQTADGRSLALHFSRDAVTPLAAGLAQAARTKRIPGDQPFQASPASVRILAHRRTGQACVRFDEGTDHEANFALSPDQMTGFVRQAQDCLAYLTRRFQN